MITYVIFVFPLVASRSAICLVRNFHVAVAPIHSSTQIQYSKNSKEQNCVDWTERLKRSNPSSVVSDVPVPSERESG